MIGVPTSAAASNSAYLPMKPENGGSPPRLTAGMKYSTAITGAARISPLTRRIEVLPARRSIEPDGEEQRRLHDDVVDHVVDRRADRRRRRDREPEHHVADVADERERQDALQLRLRDRAEHADDHRGERDDHQQEVDVVLDGTARVSVRIIA